MGKSLHRKCVACQKIIKSNHGDHARDKCKKGFTEWIYLNRHGKVVPEDELPHRETRNTTEKVAESTLDKSEGASCWYKLKRKPVATIPRKERIEGWIYLMELIVANDKRISRDLFVKNIPSEERIKYLQRKQQSKASDSADEDLSD